MEWNIGQPQSFSSGEREHLNCLCVNFTAVQSANARLWKHIKSIFPPETGRCVESCNLLALALADLGEDALPFNVRLVIGVDGLGDIHGVLENLASAGVEHGQLRQSAPFLSHTRAGGRINLREWECLGGPMR